MNDRDRDENEGVETRRTPGVHQVVRALEL